MTRQIHTLTGTQFYRNGEAVDYTGAAQTLHGATAYELIVVADSHRVGAKLWTYTAPPIVAQGNAECATLEDGGEIAFRSEGR